MTKTGYFNTGFIFLRCKILPDINQNDIKTAQKNYKNTEANIFDFFLFEWAEPGPNTCVNSAVNSVF